MRQEFIDKVISEVNNTWIGNYEGKEIAFIKNYRADSEEEGHEDEVETLQYYCDTL